MGCITGPIGGWERRGSHRYEAVRTGVRKGANQDAIHDGEDCCVCADGEGQGQDSDRGKTAVLQKRAKRQADVLPYLITHLPRDPDRLLPRHGGLCPFDVSELTERCATRLVLVHPTGDA